MKNLYHHSRILYCFLQGDELLSVNGINVRGKSAFDVSSMLQGPKETYVTIEVGFENFVKGIMSEEFLWFLISYNLTSLSAG